MFFGFLLILLILWLIIKNPDFFKNLFEAPQKNDNANKEALKILNEKFVKGEITEEEYLRKKKLLED
ncbi:SHOCT domain-containing protein [Thermosipho ferrireducens]|uniref:SHOCT domain-containing protein n=2 Tax=Thermosipho ferrireducens TaxID=2571116 RepID=A0ABX7S8K7_9BACT|nr:SHOCT domain-containing protein [Thermosipho ferrireducens]